MNALQIIVLIFVSLIVFVSTAALIVYVKESTPDPNGWSKPKTENILLIVGLSIVIGIFIGVFFISS